MALDNGNETAQLKTCRICLDMDSKLYSMKCYKLDQSFTQLTGLSIEEIYMPLKLCIECATRLRNFERFRDKCFRSNDILISILAQNQYISIKHIKAIDRQKTNLASNLTISNTSLGDETDIQTYQDDDIFSNDIKTPSQDPIQEENKVYDIQFDCDYKVESDVKFDDDTKFDIDIAPAFDSDSSQDVPIIKLIQDKKLMESKLQVNGEIHVGSKKRKSSKSKTKASKEKPQKPEKKEPSKYIPVKTDRRRRPLLNELSETLFTIIDLTTEEQIMEIDKRKDSMNFKNSPFKCMECFKGFLFEEAYKTHMIRHTSKSGNFPCDICKSRFKNSKDLRKHFTANHRQRFNCNCCEYVTTHRQAARLHEKYHKGTLYKCPHCGDMFAKFTTYMGHLRIKHPSDFVCELCGFSFVSQKGIDFHKKLKHSLDDDTVREDGPYCELCDVRFVSEEALKRHLQVSAKHVEGNKRPRVSNARRPKGPPPRPKLKRDDNDKKIGDDDKKSDGPMSCEQCGQQMEDSRAYHSHFRRHHPDKNRTQYPAMKTPCMCEVCGRIFQSYALLKDHRFMHTEEKPFSCDVCNKSFRMKQRLVTHKKIHSTQRNTYVCHICGKHFSTPGNRQRHVFIHSGLRPYKCELCDKTFKQPAEKKSHVAYVHQKKPWPKRDRRKKDMNESDWNKE